MSEELSAAAIAVPIDSPGAARVAREDSHFKRLVERYPHLGVALGWASAASLFLGYAATALGHVEKLRQTIFEQVGPERLAWLHLAMVVLAIALLVAGYVGAAIWFHRRFLSRETRALRRRGWMSALVLGFHALIAVSVFAAIPKPPDNIGLMQEVTAKWERELLATQNTDGGMRYSKTDRTVESQVWTTAQVLVALLSSQRPMAEETGIKARKAFDFIENSELQDKGEGWGYFEYVPWGVSEINAWVVIAMARSLRPEAAASIWGTGLEVPRTRLGAYAKLVADRAMPDGGWAPINEKGNPRFARTYSTLMSTWALLEARRATRSSDYDDRIRGGLTWLLQHYDAPEGGWVPNPDRKNQTESVPGLTAQTLFVLQQAQDGFEDALAPANFEASVAEFAEWMHGANVALKRESVFTRPIEDNDRSHDSDRYLPRSKYMVESSTYLWYPWMLLGCVELSHRTSAGRDGVTLASCSRLTSRIDELIKLTKSDPFTYVTAESLIAVDQYIESASPTASAGLKPRRSR